MAIPELTSPRHKSRTENPLGSTRMVHAGEGREACPGDCLEHDEHIYILCYGSPVIVRDRDYLHDDPSIGYPITHYVGWTSQLPPIKRVRQHGAKSAHYVAEIRPGTMRDEAHAKQFETCPRCGQSLWYYAESPTYSEEFVRHAAPGQAAQQAAGDDRVGGDRRPGLSLPWRLRPRRRPPT